MQEGSRRYRRILIAVRAGAIAIAFIEDGHCRLISRNGYRFGGFRELEESLAQALQGRTAILDGEVMCQSLGVRLLLRV